MAWSTPIPRTYLASKPTIAGRATTKRSWPSRSSARGQPGLASFGRRSSRARRSLRSQRRGRNSRWLRWAFGPVGCAPFTWPAWTSASNCAVAVGMMTTWRDYILHKSHTHTWMVYPPLLPNELDYPEILGLRVPLPTLVLNDSEDQLFTLPEMQRADCILADVFAKAGASDPLPLQLLPGPHKFDVPMQEEAFAWFARWLG
ncbi:MAG: hypothetical protein R2856_25235 [Caldilineaceae bacterium]